MLPQISPARLYFLLLSAVAGTASAQTTTRVSVGASGTQGDLDSYPSSISADGRYVLIYSEATNLVPGDTNGATDVFLRDRLNGTTTLVSVDSAGAQGNSGSESGAVSSDGRFVAFDSFATNLVPGDTNGSWDVFVRDLQDGTTRRVSVSSGLEANGNSYGADISGDGRFVAFSSDASNLVPGDTNRRHDIFVRDRLLGKTTRVSVDSSGAQGDQGAGFCFISDDGRYVVFDSSSTNLVPGDTNGFADIFEHDLVTGATTRVNVDSNGAQANSYGAYATISADGRYTEFGSPASNLVPGDTNEDYDVFVHDLLTGTTTRVSVDSNGLQADGYSSRGTISADGRFAAFKSTAANLVAGDTNASLDVFVRDLLRGTTERLSVSSSGAEGNAFSSYPLISADGKHIAFYSEASNLVRHDTNGSDDVFVRSFGKIGHR